MTNEEALNNLKQKLLNTDMPNTIRVAISAIERQIPKKPMQEDCFTCPSCENYLIYGDKYCQECGQLICWDLEGEDDDNT